MFYFAKILIFFGILLISVGFIFLIGGKLFSFGKLPGDIYIKKGNFIFFAPIGTAILISFLLSIIFYIISRIFK